MAQPSRRGWEMIIIVTVLVALATISAFLRLTARIKLRLSLQMDDHLCFIGMILLYGMYIELVLCEFPYILITLYLLTSSLGCTIGGNGTHIQDIGPEEMLNFGKVNDPKA